MKTTTLCFTIRGKAKDINKRSEEYMRTMSKIMGKEIDGITLVALQRKDNFKPQFKLGESTINY